MFLAFTLPELLNHIRIFDIHSFKTKTYRARWNMYFQTQTWIFT